MHIGVPKEIKNHEYRVGLTPSSVREIVAQLQGFEIPANAWERQVLASRIVDYDPKWLDQLCLTGAVGWGRLSPHPATLDYSNPTRAGEREPGASPRQRRVIPTSVAPITFFVREDADWMTPRHPGPDQPGTNGLSLGAQVVIDFLRQRGASFFADIVRGTGKLKAEIETALWELVAAGLVTADGFDNLRSLIDPKRRAGQGSGRMARPRHNAGRWAILHADELVERSLRRAALWDEVKAKLNRSGLELSGGQQQRLCIARTLAVEPEVILMDEPCSALDPISTARVEDLMDDLKNDYTIVIVTHNMQQARRVSDLTACLMLDEASVESHRTGILAEFSPTDRLFTNPKDKRTEAYITGRIG